MSPKIILEQEENIVFSTEEIWCLKKDLVKINQVIKKIIEKDKLSQTADLTALLRMTQDELNTVISRICQKENDGAPYKSVITYD